MRVATARAAMRRGCVWPIRPRWPRPASSAILGSCVVFPEPVAPLTMTTACAKIASAMSLARCATGRSSGKSIAGVAAWRAAAFATAAWTSAPSDFHAPGLPPDARSRSMRARRRRASTSSVSGRRARSGRAGSGMRVRSQRWIVSPTFVVCSPPSRAGADSAPIRPARFLGGVPMTAFSHRSLALLTALALSAASFALDAKTLRWAGRGDPQTMDPYSQNENLTNNINALIYDTLVMRDRDLKVIPGLATSWEQINPTTWRFKLRQGVKFHDGSPFTPEDVVFSFERASADTSQIRAYATASGKPRIVDEATVEFVTDGPNPIELEHLVTIFIMSKSWCEKNKCLKPLDFKNKEEMITARGANGTG